METINLNAAECIKTSASIGHMTYTNICSGVVSRVDWGSLDWLIFGGLSTFALGVMLVIIGTIFVVARG